MRRFWGGRRGDFSFDELEAFYSNLPDDSATMKSDLQLEVDLKTFLNAVTVDAISSLHTGMAGKKLKDTDRLAKMFTKKKDKNKTTTESRRAAAIRAGKKAKMAEAAKAAESKREIESIDVVSTDS